jgi:hypothetical protein
MTRKPSGFSANSMQWDIPSKLTFIQTRLPESSLYCIRGGRFDCRTGHSIVLFPFLRPSSYFLTDSGVISKMLFFVKKNSPFLTNLDALLSERMSALGGEFSTDDIGDFTTDLYSLVISWLELSKLKPIPS